LVFLICDFALAEPWAFYGNGIAAFDTQIAPSGRSGESEFSIPQLQLGVSTLLSEKTEFNALMDVGGTREADSGRYFAKLEEVVLATRRKPESPVQISMGLLPKPGLTQYRNLWERFFVLDRNDYSTFQEYLPQHDLGLEVSRTFWNAQGTLILQITNGEGEDSGETGRRKDAHIFFDYSSDEKWGASVFASEGSYDNIDPKKNDRDRWGLMVRYFDPEIKIFRGFAVQFLDSRDAVDGLPLLFGDGADLAPGDVIFGRTVQAWAVGGFQEWSWFASGSLRDLDTHTSDDTIQKVLLGVNRQWEENFMSSLQLEHGHYGENHSPGIRDTQQVRFLTRIDFD
jgi:hypothetical protein